MAITTRFASMTQFDSALVYAQRALALGRQSGSTDLQVAALTVLSIDYAQIGREDSTLLYEGEMLKLCSRPCPAAALPVAYLSRFYPDSQRFRLLKLAEEISSRSSTPYVRARVLDMIGSYYTEQAKLPDIGLRYHRSVDSMRLADEQTAYGIGRAFRALGEPDSASQYFGIELYMARTRGAAWHEGYALGNLGQICHKDVVPPRLSCAIAYYDSTLMLVESQLRRLGSDDNRTTAAEFAEEIYEDLVFAVLEAGRSTSEALGARASLVVSELGRAPGLLDYLRGGEDSTTPSSRSVLPQGRPYDVMEYGGSNTYTLSYFLGRDTLLIWLALPDHQVRVTRRRFPNDSVVTLVSALRQELGVEASVIDSRMRGRAGQPASRRPLPASRATSALYHASAVLLPSELLQLVPPNADLVIVAQSVLALVPFAALPIEDRSSGELGARYAIRYTPSMSVLRGLETLHSKREGHQPLSKRLVVSNPKMPQVDIGKVLDGTPEGLSTLSSLPGSQAEGAWVASRLRTLDLTGAAATETRVRAALEGSEIIHLATHAVATEYARLGSGSFLAFAPDATNDGLLTVADILGMPDGSIPAQLVVLSACQTAVGPVRFVEGTMGLQRAFLAKGTESVLASLWSVNDEATQQLMKRFYSHWLDDTDDPTKAEALQRAQEDVRRMPGFEDPVYWAGFQLIGLN